MYFMTYYMTKKKYGYQYKKVYRFGVISYLQYLQIYGSVLQ